MSAYALSASNNLNEVMIIEKCEYNKEKDVCEVDQIGFVNLREAWETHTVDGNLNVDELNFNEIDDPASIMGKPSNVFDAMQMQGYINSQVENPE